PQPGRYRIRTKSFWMYYAKSSGLAFPLKAGQAGLDRLRFYPANKCPASILLNPLQVPIIASGFQAAVRRRRFYRRVRLPAFNTPSPRVTLTASHPHQSRSIWWRRMALTWDRCSAAFPVLLRPQVSRSAAGHPPLETIWLSKSAPDKSVYSHLKDG